MDRHSHALDVDADHPLDGVLMAQCGLLVTVVAPLHDEPHGAVCQACADRQYDDASARLVVGRPISSHRGCPQCLPAAASNVLFERLAATVEQLDAARQIQILIGQVLALAGEQETELTNEELRDQLTALTEGARRYSASSPVAAAMTTDLAQHGSAGSTSRTSDEPTAHRLRSRTR